MESLDTMVDFLGEQDFWSDSLFNMPPLSSDPQQPTTPESQPETVKPSTVNKKNSTDSMKERKKVRERQRRVEVNALFSELGDFLKLSGKQDKAKVLRNALAELKMLKRQNTDMKQLLGDKTKCTTPNFNAMGKKRLAPINPSVQLTAASSKRSKPEPMVTAPFVPCFVPWNEDMMKMMPQFMMAQMKQYNKSAKPSPQKPLTAAAAEEDEITYSHCA